MTASAAARKAWKERTVARRSLYSKTWREDFPERHRRSRLRRQRRIRAAMTPEQTRSMYDASNAGRRGRFQRDPLWAKACNLYRKLLRGGVSRAEALLASGYARYARRSDDKAR